MYRVVPSPVGGMCLQDEHGVVLASGSTAHDLRLNMAVAMERRELYPFIMVRDEFGAKVMLKDYVRR